MGTYLPERWCGVKVMIDTNAINARQADHSLNQIETWHKDDVIRLLMPEPAYAEAVAGSSIQREEKASRLVRARSGRISSEHHAMFGAIERAIFPTGAVTNSQRNDVEIVYEAAAWVYILVTNDGDSRRQRRGILGARAALSRLGVKVMRPEEAVAFIRERIERRDQLISSNCKATRTPIPDWLGAD